MEPPVGNAPRFTMPPALVQRNARSPPGVLPAPTTTEPSRLTALAPELVPPGSKPRPVKVWAEAMEPGWAAPIATAAQSTAVGRSENARGIAESMGALLSPAADLGSATRRRRAGAVVRSGHGCDQDTRTGEVLEGETVRGRVKSWFSACRDRAIPSP